MIGSTSGAVEMVVAVTLGGVLLEAVIFFLAHTADIISKLCIKATPVTPTPAYEEAKDSANDDEK